MSNHPYNQNRLPQFIIIVILLLNFANLDRNLKITCRIISINILYWSTVMNSIHIIFRLQLKQW